MHALFVQQAAVEVIWITVTHCSSTARPPLEQKSGLISEVATFRGNYTPLWDFRW